MTKLPYCVIVSGANRGIGLELTRYFLGNGAEVIATCRNPIHANELISLKSKYDRFLKIETLDLLSESSIHDLATRLSMLDRSFDLIISNAGVSDNEPFGQWTIDSFKNNLLTNTIGPAIFAQALSSLMKNGAKLINMSSGMSSMEHNLNVTAPLDAYAISKAGLNMVTRRLANHLADRQISVVSISPGWVKTDMGGAEAPMTAKQAALLIAKRINEITLRESGMLLNYDGSIIPW